MLSPVCGQFGFHFFQPLPGLFQFKIQKFTGSHCLGFPDFEIFIHEITGKSIGDPHHSVGITAVEPDGKGLCTVPGLLNFHPDTLPHLSDFVFQIHIRLVRIQVELINDFFKVAPAQNLLGDRADPLIDAGGYNGLHIFRRHTLR